ncbi:hypothetical protein JG687_00017649 [Phytophthora cactorum]|uniref:SET domain-containing protein n=1 Tax=Phytophthora cactorum TaxID=29920 RepID=A0A8T1TNS9_9STRA|nr:hypothetical protein JG687_00017649 [Phytophthora cactorum]
MPQYYPGPNRVPTASTFPIVGGGGGRCIPDGETRDTSTCINQDIICDVSNCLVGPGCGNLMKQQFHLDLITTSVGLGVVCNTTIPKYAFIIEYVCEVLLRSDAVRLLDQCYQVQLRAQTTKDSPTDIFIDAPKFGIESRFINYSCSHNCARYEMEWTNTSRLDIFAKTDIPPLRELTFCYCDRNLSMFACRCQRSNCVSNHP